MQYSMNQFVSHFSGLPPTRSGWPHPHRIICVWVLWHDLWFIYLFFIFYFCDCYLQVLVLVRCLLCSSLEWYTAYGLGAVPIWTVGAEPDVILSTLLTVKNLWNVYTPRNTQILFQRRKPMTEIPYKQCEQIANLTKHQKLHDPHRC